MKYDSPGKEFTRLHQQHDYIGLKRLFLGNPDFVNDQVTFMLNIHFACIEECPINIFIVLEEVSFNFNTNFIGHGVTRRLLDIASASKRWNAVKWLIEHGVEINYKSKPDGLAYCVPLNYILLQKQYELAKMLINRGAVLDVCNSSGVTPLVLVRDPKNAEEAEIRELILTKGGVLPEQARNYVPPPPNTPVMQFMRKHGYDCALKPIPWQPIVRDSIHVDLYYLLAPDHFGAFTDGMSNLAMITPAGKEKYRFAELICLLGPDWPDDSPKRWGEDHFVWMLQWLRKLANIPFKENTWLGEPFGIISNNEPPEPLSQYCHMTCWLCIPNRKPFKTFKRADKTEVVFYEVIPIHAAERDYAQKKGHKALLKLLEKHGAYPYLKPMRESVV